LLAGCGDDDPVAPDTTLRVRFEPSALELTTGQTFELRIDIDNARDLFAMRCEVSLPLIVTTDDPPARRGDLFSERSLFLAVPGGGTLSVGSTEVQTGGIDAVSGSGTFAILRLRAGAPGTGAVALSLTELLDEEGGAISANVSVPPVTVTITGGQRDGSSSTEVAVGR
jgi:hypothetical protein